MRITKRTRTSLPATVKRNTLHLAASQAVFTMVAQAAYVIAPLVVYAMTASVTLAGLAVSVIYGGRVLVVYETGKLMDRIGRNPVLLFGIALGSLALFSMGWAVIFSQLELVWLGLLVFGCGSGILQQSRIPVLDMYPNDRRGEGIGYLMTGNVVGSLLSPVFTAALIPVASLSALNTYGAILLVSAVILAASSVFITRVKPDSREIARNFLTYYPHETSSNTSNSVMKDSSLRRAIMVFPIFAAFVASALAWGDMNMVTSLAPLVLHHYDVVLTLISLSLTVHTLGMFALSVPFGWMTDKVGRKVVILLGGILLSVGVFLTPFTSDYAIMTFAIFLAGLGWSATNVATSALISDLTPSERRGRLFGANDVATGSASVSLLALGSAVIANLGLLAFGLLGLVVGLSTLLIALPIREVGIGHYAHSPVLNKTERPLNIENATRV